MSKKKHITPVPTWDSDAKFEITGAEFLKIKQAFDIFAEPFFILESIFGRHLNSGTIKIKYEDENGNEVPQEELEKKKEAI